MAKQLPLDIALRPALAREDFLVAQSNSAAINLIDQWPNWPSYGAVIVGPEGSGKTHLLEVWRQTTGAKLLGPELMDAFFSPSENCFALDDVERGLISEDKLFHLLNHVRHNSGSILLASRTWPISGLVLPDLTSRLAALPSANILPPDDALLRGVLVKQFSDRQISVDEPLISYMVARMPRSLGMARKIVQRIDEAALELKAEVSRPLVGKVLAEFEFSDQH